MKISDFLSPELIFLDIRGETKKEILTTIIDRMIKNNPEIKNGSKFKNEVLERELLGSTGIGDEFAIPHARTKQINRILICFARTQQGIEFEALDGLKVRYIFLIAVPIDELKIYLTALAAISRLVKNNEVRQLLKTASNSAEFINSLRILEQQP